EMTEHHIVSRDEWLAARKELLVKEKEFTRLRDRLSAERGALPWGRIEMDHVDGIRVHLEQRDVSYVAVSRAPWPEIEVFRKRMGWQIKWVSSHDSDFNY